MTPLISWRGQRGRLVDLGVPKGRNENSPARFVPACRTPCGGRDELSAGYELLKEEVPSGTAENMAHSYLCCLVHVVFSTAERRPLIKEGMQKRLHAYLGGIARENGMGGLAVGGSDDHVHGLLSLSRTASVSKAVQLLKAGSSKWIHETFPGLRRFSWQEGYGAFSIGVAQKEQTVRYIHGQAAHHKRVSFAEEFSKFLSAHGMGEDEFSRP